MKRFIPTVFLLLFLSISPALAAKIGILFSKKSTLLTAPVEGFKTIAGSDVLELDMEGNEAQGKPLCDQLKAAKPQLILAVGPEAAVAAVQAITDIPIVFCMVMDPEKNGVKGPNVTGVTLDIPMIKQFESFKSLIPKLKKVGLVYSDNTSDALAQEMRQAAQKSGLTLVDKKVSSESEVPQAVRDLKGQIDGLYLPPDRNVLNRDAFQFIALFTFENNLPFMAPTSRFVQKGALIALMIDYEDVGKQTGEMAKKILEGKAPSALKVEPPRATVLVLNLKTAQTIGINVPPALLEKSEVIK